MCKLVPSVQRPIIALQTFWLLGKGSQWRLALSLLSPSPLFFRCLPSVLLEQSGSFLDSSPPVVPVYCLCIPITLINVRSSVLSSEWVLVLLSWCTRISFIMTLLTLTALKFWGFFFFFYSLYSKAPE